MLFAPVSRVCRDTYRVSACACVYGWTPGILCAMCQRSPGAVHKLCLRARLCAQSGALTFQHVFTRSAFFTGRRPRRVCRHLLTWRLHFNIVTSFPMEFDSANHRALACARRSMATTKCDDSILRMSARPPTIAGDLACTCRFYGS